VKVAAVPQRGTIPWVLLKTTVVTPGKLIGRHLRAAAPRLRGAHP
jgi:hypothetical protein